MNPELWWVDILVGFGLVYVFGVPLAIGLGLVVRKLKEE